MLRRDSNYQPSAPSSSANSKDKRSSVTFILKDTTGNVLVIPARPQLLSIRRTPFKNLQNNSEAVFYRENETHQLFRVGAPLPWSSADTSFIREHVFWWCCDCCPPTLWSGQKWRAVRREWLSLLKHRLDTTKRFLQLLWIFLVSGPFPHQLPTELLLNLRSFCDFFFCFWGGSPSVSRAAVPLSAWAMSGHNIFMKSANASRLSGSSVRVSSVHQQFNTCWALWVSEGGRPTCRLNRGSSSDQQTAACQSPSPHCGPGPGPVWPGASREGLWDFYGEQALCQMLQDEETKEFIFGLPPHTNTVLQGGRRSWTCGLLHRSTQTQILDLHRSAGFCGVYNVEALYLQLFDLLVLFKRFSGERHFQPVGSSCRQHER